MLSNLDRLDSDEDAKLTKGLRTQEKIIQSAIRCLARFGHEKTTFQVIADHCELSQSLVVHYFKKKENVFPSVVEYLTNRTQSIIDRELDHQRTPTERLNDFVKISLGYARNEPDSAKIFLTLSFLATFDERYRANNAEIRQLAVNEIIEILIAGIQSGEFKVENVTLTAKLMAGYLAGVRMMLLNEKPLLPDETLIAEMQRHCLTIVTDRVKRV